MRKLHASQHLTPPTYPTCILLLRSCSSISHLVELHAQIIRNHLFFSPFASSRLLHLYTTLPLASLRHAHHLFDQIPQRTTHSFNSLIKAYSNSPWPFKSFGLFRRMIKSNIQPDYFTFPFLLKSCTEFSTGSQIHGYMVKSGFDRDVFSINSLIHMHASCGKIELAYCVFDTTIDRDVATWTILLSGYINKGLINHAKYIFDEMPDKNIISYNAMIHGYMKTGNVSTARKLFDDMPMRNVDSWNTLIAGYIKCRDIIMATKLFEEMPTKDIISWSTIITGCVQLGRANEALSFFEEMKELGFKPNKPAIISLISACSQIGFLEQAIRVHDYINTNKIKFDSIIGSALIDMYMKCGCTQKSFDIFHMLVEKNVISYTAMIHGLALNGEVSKAIEIFTQMEDKKIRPNESTFVGILCACSHSGQIDLALKYFESMKVKYGIKPQIEHYGCLVDTFCRAGYLQEAMTLVKSFPNNKILWGCLLGACSIYGDDKIGEIAVKRLMKLKPGFGGVHMLLSNIYSVKGRWDEAGTTKFKIDLDRLETTPRHSTVEVVSFI